MFVSSQVRKGGAPKFKPKAAPTSNSTVHVVSNLPNGSTGSALGSTSGSVSSKSASGVSASVSTQSTPGVSSQPSSLSVRRDAAAALSISVPVSPQTAVKKVRFSEQTSSLTTAITTTANAKSILIHSSNVNNSNNNLPVPSDPPLEDVDFPIVPVIRQSAPPKIIRAANNANGNASRQPSSPKRSSAFTILSAGPSSPSKSRSPSPVFRRPAHLQSPVSTSAPTSPVLHSPPSSSFNPVPVADGDDDDADASTALDLGAIEDVGPITMSQLIELQFSHHLLRPSKRAIEDINAKKANRRKGSRKAAPPIDDDEENNQEEQQANEATALSLPAPPSQKQNDIKKQRAIPAPSPIQPQPPQQRQKVGPKTKIVDGRIVIDDASLFIDTALGGVGSMDTEATDREIMDVIDESNPGSGIK
ncbi:hypothetical protein HK100_007543, partial [Physocladia obscura]